MHNNLLIAKYGQRVTYASPRFMSAYKHDDSHILIQRGFRQYGQPQESMVSNMKVIEQDASYEHGLCNCNCEICAKEKHPIYNCLGTCQASDHAKLKYIECWCLCSECILKGGHSRKDCHHTCKLQKIEK